MKSAAIRATFRNWAIRSGAVASSGDPREFDDRLPGDSLPRGSRHKALERVSPHRLFAVWLQIAAIALLLAVSSRAEAIHMRTMAFGDSLIAGPDGVPCDVRSGDKAPTHQHRDHSPCCIFCTAAGRDLSTLFIGVALRVAHDFARRTGSDVAYRITNGRNPWGLRLAKAWSPRAPPSFS